MTSGEIQGRLMAVERELMNLRARPAVSGAGVSQLSGVTHVRTMQLGFPAEITSTFDSATGYDWEQVLLVVDATPAVENETYPLTGNQAHTPDNDTTLAPGDRGWMEVDPQAGGYIFVKGGTGGGRYGWFARLTTSTGSPPTSWKWYEVGLDSGGSWVDIGSEAASFNAYPSKIDPTLTCNPMPGMRVWMWSSRESGKYEFMVVLSPPLLCEVTAYDGATKYHTVEQKTWNTTSDTIVDFSPATTYTKCVSTTETEIDAGTRVMMFKIPDRDGEHWIQAVDPPAAPAPVEDWTQLPATFTLSTGTSFQTVTGLTETIPSDGRYRVWYDISMDLSDDGTVGYDYTESQLCVNGTAIGGDNRSTRFVCNSAAAGFTVVHGDTVPNLFAGVGSATAEVTDDFTAADVLQVKARFAVTGGATETARVVYGVVGYERLGD